MSALTQQSFANERTPYFALANSISTISDAKYWSDFPAIQTVDMSGYGISNILSLQLDAQVLTANASELFLNGVPIATIPDISNVSDWALYPALGNIDANNYAIQNLSGLELDGNQLSTVGDTILVNGSNPVSNWSAYNATTDVNVSGHNIISQISGQGTFGIGSWNTLEILGGISGATTTISGFLPVPLKGDIFIQSGLNKDGDITLQSGLLGNSNIKIRGFIEQESVGGGTAISNYFDSAVQVGSGTGFLGVDGIGQDAGYSAMYVKGGTTLDGGGLVHGITIGTLPALGINTQRIDVTPLGILMTTPTFITMNGLGAADIAMGGAVAIAAGSYVTLEHAAGAGENGIFVQNKDRNCNARMVFTGGGTIFNLNNLQTSTIEIANDIQFWNNRYNPSGGIVPIRPAAFGEAWIDVSSHNAYFATLTAGKVPAPQLSSNSVYIGNLVNLSIGNATSAIVIGDNTGMTGQQSYATAIGRTAGFFNQGTDAIAVGQTAGYISQGCNSVALGQGAGERNLGSNSIAIGKFANVEGASIPGTIVLNATGVELNPVNANAVYISPMRNISLAGFQVLARNSGTGEVIQTTVDAGSLTPSNWSSYPATTNVNMSNYSITNASGGTFTKLTLNSSNIALGVSAGYTGQGTNAVSIGTFAGLGTQGLGAIAMGYSAGTSNQGNYSVALGTNAGATVQGGNCVAVGFNAGLSNQTDYAVAVGRDAGSQQQSSNAIAVGRNAATVSQGSASVAIGFNAGASNQQTNSIAIGYNAGSISQITTAIAIGAEAGLSNQGGSTVAIGLSAGAYNQLCNSIAIGQFAGYSNQSNACVAIGALAGNLSQGQSCIAIGRGAGSNSQGVFSVAVGRSAGLSNMGSNAVAVGYQSGQNSQGVNAVAVGYLAGLSGQGAGAVGIGYAAGSNTQGTQAVSMGTNAGASNQQSYSVALGYTAGYISQSQYSVAIGSEAGASTQGGLSVAVGVNAGVNTQGGSATSIGAYTGANSQGANATAAGAFAAQFSQGSGSVAIGYYAANTAQGIDSVAIGSGAGYSGLGANSVAIGNRASGTGGSFSNTVVINATGAGVNPAQANSCYVAPIRETPNSNAYQTTALVWNTVTKEVNYDVNLFSLQVLAVSATPIVLTPNLRGKIFILTGGGTQALTTTGLTANDTNFFCIIRNGAGTGGGLDVTLTGVTGATTIHNQTGATNAGQVYCTWTGSALVAY